MLRLLTEYRHKRFFRPRCTVSGVRFATARDTVVHRVSLSIGPEQLCSMSSFAAGTPQHSTLWLVVRCSRRATRQRCGHRHAGAVRRTSVSLAFCCPRTCVRGQHLIVPPTNAATAAARMQPQTCTKNSTNPSHLSSKQTPHISHSPAYKNTNPSHFPPAPAPPPLQPSPSIYIYTNPSHFTLPDSPLTPQSPHCPDSPSLGPPLPGSRLPAPGFRAP